LIPAGFAVVLKPVMDGGTADNIEQLFLEVKQNGIANYVSIVATRNVLLGFIDVKVLEAIYAVIRKQADRVGPLNVHICHMKGLVEQYAGLLPGSLFITPVRVLRLNNRIDIRSRRRISQHRNWISGGLDQVLQASVLHNK